MGRLADAASIAGSAGVAAILGLKDHPVALRLHHTCAELHRLVPLRSFGCGEQLRDRGGRGGSIDGLVNGTKGKDRDATTTWRCTFEGSLRYSCWVSSIDYVRVISGWLIPLG